MKAIKIVLPVKTVKRLFAAEGYLQLGMPDYALSELALIEDATPVEASIEFLTGEAFRQQERYDDAVESLERAARLIPEPYNKAVWLSLSDCFRQRGDEELADIAATFAAEAESAAGEFEFDSDDFEPDDFGVNDFDPDDFGPDDFGGDDFGPDEPESFGEGQQNGSAGPSSDRWN